MTGHCSNCGKIWTLEARQGLCQWCGKLALCQTTQAKPRQLKSSPKRRIRQAQSNGNGYDQLEGDWLTYYKIARYFVHKVKIDDREDFLHDLMLEMAEVKAKYEAKGKPLTEAGLMRVASYEVTDYWHTLMRHRPTMLSLNYADDFDGDGEKTELLEFLADDKAVDLDLRLDARRCLQGCPRWVVQIAYKKYAGYRLDAKEQNRLDYWRKKNDQLKFRILSLLEGDNSGSTD